MKNSGISFTSILGLTFIVLKLCKVIDWSWWYVTLPLWGGFVLSIIVVIICIYYRLKY